MSGIVIDLGYSQTTIAKVIDGTVDRQVESCQFGGSYIIEALKLSVLNYGSFYQNKISVILDMNAINETHISYWEDVIQKYLDYNDKMIDDIGNKGSITLIFNFLKKRYDRVQCR